MICSRSILALVTWAVPATATTAPPVTPPSPPEEELSVVVTGARGERSRAMSAAAVEVITRAEIDARGATTLADALALQPGVEVTQTYRGFTLRLQGLDPEYVLVLVDGERVQGRVGGAIDLSRFPVDDIERIEIVKGAGSALYGSDAVAGVVNIITRRTRRPLELGGQASVRSRGAMDASYRVGVRQSWFDVLLSFGHHRAEAWDLTPLTPGTTSSAYRTWDGSLAGALRVGNSFKLGARAEFLRRRQEGVGDSATGAVFDRKTLSEQAAFTLVPEWRTSERGRVQLTAHYGVFADQYLSDQRGADALDQFQKTREHLGRAGAQVEQPFGAWHLLTAGLEGIIEQTSSPRLAGGQASRQRAAVYAQHEWTVLDGRRLVLVPGLRVDGDSQFGTHASPKLAVRHDPHPTLALRGSYGWGFRAPSFQELYLVFENPGAGYQVGGNPALSPERSRTASLGAEWRPSQSWLISLGAFRTDLRDMILVRLSDPNQVGEISRYSYANVAAAHSQGLESSVAADVGGGLRADLGYVLTFARDEEAGRDLEGRARHRWTFGMGYRHARASFSAQARGTVVGARPFYVDSDGDGVEESERARPYAMLGLRVAQVVWRAFELFAGAENLFGAGDERHAPLAPRTFYLGINIAK